MWAMVLLRCAGDGYGCGDGDRYVRTSYVRHHTRPNDPTPNTQQKTAPKTTQLERGQQAPRREERTEGFKRISYQPNSNSTMGDRVTGPLGVDPLHYVCVVFGLLICWVGYLLLPKGMRQQHFNAYPKRFRWSARPRTKRGDANGGAGKGQVSSMAATGSTFQPSQLLSRPVGWLVGFRHFLFFVFQFKNWRIVIVLFSYSHFILHLTNRPNNHHQ